jgi:hypothetical protein
LPIKLQSLKRNRRGNHHGHLLLPWDEILALGLEGEGYGRERLLEIEERIGFL